MFCLVLLVYVSCICLTVWLIITITIYLQARPFTTMLYITQTKHSIQSTNISTNDMVLYWGYTVLSINVSIAWRASDYMDIF